MRLFLILATSLSWYTHCLERNIALGFDFLIYYRAGQGILTEGWVYNAVFSNIFTPLSSLPFNEAYLYWYSILVGCWFLVVRRVHPILFVLSFYPALLGLETSNLTLLLAALCTTPVGAVLAACVKPWLAVFVVFHAARLWHRTRVGGDLEEESPDFLTHTH